MIHLISGIIAVSSNLPIDTVHQVSTFCENYVQEVVPSAVQKGSNFVSDFAMEDYDLSFEEDVSLWVCCCGKGKK